MIFQSLKIMWKKRGQNGFILFELFLSFIILFAVYSLIKSELDHYTEPLGFNTKNVGAAFIDFDAVKNTFTDEDKKLDSIGFRQKLDFLKDALLATPGINHASYSINVIPFNNSNWMTSNKQDDSTFISYDRSSIIFADEDYAKVFEPNITHGRWFKDEDILGENTFPVVVNQKFVDASIPKDQNILGNKMMIYGATCIIVGVVEHFKYQGEFKEEVPLLIPHMDLVGSYNSIILQFDDSTNPNWEYDVQQVLEQQLKDVTFYQYRVENDRIQTSKSNWTTIWGLLALSLFIVINVAMGIFGIIQYNIKKRKGEIGLRKALGANDWKISLQFLSEILLLTSIAIIVGILISIQVPLLDIFDIKKGVFYSAIGFATLFIYTIVIICSILPCLQASKLPAALALRNNG